MNNKRKVGFAVLFGLLKKKGPFSLVGSLFVAISIFVVFPIVLITSVKLKEPYEKYDFQKIESNGIEKVARITYIKTLDNVSINGEHPEVISYEYDNNGKKIADKFETFDLEKTAQFKEGTSIKILEHQGQTMIKGLKPFGFPFYIFYFIPTLFLLIGIPFLLVGLIPALKTFNLYRTGIVKDAQIISIDAGSNGLAWRNFTKSFFVNYSFKNNYGKEVFGGSATTDLLFLNEKRSGDVIKIFVSEMDENTSCLVPKFEALKYNWSI